MEDIKIEDLNKYSILYVDDEEPNLESFLLSFEDDFKIHTTTSASEGLNILEKEDIGLVITDERMPGMTGIEFLEQVVKKWPNTVRIIISAYSDAERLLKAINMGHAHEYIVKPWDRDSLFITLKNSLLMVKKRRQLIAKANITETLQNELNSRLTPDNFVCNSPNFKSVIETAKRVAKTDVPILINGETGTGKEVVANIIHKNSDKLNLPFVKVNCASLSEGLLESELFGHEKGAFTGAHKMRKGRFEQAEGGSILLDEIGDISPKLQQNLLRVLQEKEFERVGGNQTLKTNARIIASTHQNLQQLVDEGKFRADLFFRLNVVTLKIPPLRERIEDIEALFKYFISKYEKQYHFAKVEFADSVLEYILKYNWPGNVRELENMIQRVLVIYDGTKTITPEDFSFDIKYTSLTMKEKMRKEDDEKMIMVFKASGGNATKTAEILGIPRSTFRSRAKKIGLL